MLLPEGGVHGWKRVMATPNRTRAGRRMSISFDKTFSVAPMVDWTDRHCRYFHRLLSRRAILYTEMIAAAAVLKGDRARLLDFNAQEHPVVVQLGGSDPGEMAEAAAICAEWGYDAVNINVGCPSDKVRQGRFGAVLFREPETVAACARAMAEAVQATGRDVPITVKCRVGVDDADSDEHLAHFIDIVAEAGVRTFVIHVRKAILGGLSPKQNRTVPPLDYPRAHRMKQCFDELEIIINGGLQSMAECRAQLDHVDGVMVGRAAYQTPWLLSRVDEQLFGDIAPVRDPVEAVERFIPYVQRRLAEGVPLNAMTKHILGLFHGRPGARAFRRILSEEAPGKPGDIGVLQCALEQVRAAALTGDAEDSLQVAEQ